MPRPVKELPMAQQWDCHACGDCCRMYAVRVTAEEKARINGQDWSDVPELVDVPRIIYEKRIGDDRLNHRADGACVFLGPDNRCRIHSKFGAEAKPMACRIYPFTLVPAGDQWRVHEQQRVGFRTPRHIRAGLSGPRRSGVRDR